MASGIQPYVHDQNGWVDVFGLTSAPKSVPSTPGVYTLTNTTLNQGYVGSGVNANSRMSSASHTKAQALLNHPDTKVEFTPVDLGDAETRADQNRILRHFEQQEFEATKAKGFNMTNANNPEAAIKKSRNAGIVDEHGASKGKKVECHH